MSVDTSSNFINHIIPDRWEDLSGNYRSQVINMLSSLMGVGNFNSNLATLPLVNNFTNNGLNRILTQSLMEKTPYKKILSKKGNEQLKIVKYNKDIFDQNSCCIMFEDFKEGQDVIQLPCNHIFDCEGIKTWLREESSKCPVCRFELDFEEVKEDDEEEEVSNIAYNPYNQLFNRTENLYQSNSFISDVFSIENEYLDNRNLQNAIIASIYEQNDFNTDEEGSEPYEEEDLYDDLEEVD
jgi:hypothetical protein